MNTPDQITDSFENIRQRISDAGGSDVDLVAVTKGFGPEAMSEATRNRADAVGENYVQELLTKLDALNEVVDSLPSVYFIGQLQTNKVKYLAGKVSRYSSVDRVSLVGEISRRDPGAEVLIQVAPPATDRHGSATGKGGCALDEVDSLVDSARQAGLSVVGLMTIGPTHGGAEAAAPGFAAVRAAVDRLGLTVCSMGMSDDLEVAIAEGSNEVRVGSALFGKRRYPNR